MTVHPAKTDRATPSSPSRLSQEFYTSLKQARPESALNIGGGNNEFPLSQSFRTLLKELISFSVDCGSAFEYDRNKSYRYQRLFRSLLYEDGPESTSPHFIVNHGATESLHLLTTDLYRRNFRSALLPLGGYFGYEQILTSVGISDLYYYNAAGEVDRTLEEDAHVIIIYSSLEAMSGEFFRFPAAQIKGSSGQKARHFIIYDLPYLHQDYSIGMYCLSVLRSVLDASDPNSALVLTSSKDFSLPGLRAAMTVLWHPEMAETIELEARARHDHASSVSILVMLAYVFTCLQMRPRRLQGTFARFGQCAIGQEFHHHSIALENIIDGIAREQVSRAKQMLSRFHRNHMMIGQVSGNLFEKRSLSRWKGGYSCLPKVAGRPIDVSEALTICKRLALDHNISTYCNYTLCGSTEAWDRLSERALRFRVNLSVDEGTFRTNIETLCEGLRHLI